MVAFIRKPAQFPLNKYVQYVKTNKNVGVFAKLGRDEHVRVPSDEEFAWHDGDVRPSGDYIKPRFEWVEFATFRRAYPWTIGYMAAEQAKDTWRPKLVHTMDALAIAMTNRTKRVVTLLEATANWGSNYADVNTLNGGHGTWDTASDDPNSPNYQAIYGSLIEAARRVHLGTNGVVGMGEMRLLVGPDLAIAMSKSPEILNYVRETPNALTIVVDGLGAAASGKANPNGMWGLPSHYRGFEIVVEDSMVVTERPKASGVEATTARTYIKSGASACLVSRPGGLDGEFGSQSYSTVQVYHYGELLQVEAFDDPENRRVKGSVVEDIKEVLAAAPAGFLLTGTLPS